MACRLTGRQAIIWTNDGLFYWHIYVSLSLNELNNWAIHIRYDLFFNDNSTDVIFLYETVPI